MSGPKESDYRIMREQQRRLEEQRKAELKRREEELRKKRELEAEMRARDREKIHRTHILLEIEEELQAIEQKLQEIEAIISVAREESAAIRDSLRSARERVSALKDDRVEKNSKELAAANTELKNLSEKLSLDQKRMESRFQDASDSYQDNVRNSMRSGKMLSFSEIGGRLPETETPKPEPQAVPKVRLEIVVDALAQMETLTLSESLKEDLARLRRQASRIADQAYVNNFYSAAVRPFVKSCERYAELRELHDERMLQYVLLAEECGVQVHSAPVSQEGIEEINARIESLSKQAVQQYQKQYKDRCIDEAMEEMGYELVGERVAVKKSGKKIRHQLFSLQNGTAVDVTLTESGQVSMELGGVGDSDRMADGQEKAQLVEDMRSFCSDYARLSKILEAKGIEMARGAELPPAEEYAQIFNINDYKVKKEIVRYQVRSHRKQQEIARHKE